MAKEGWVTMYHPDVKGTSEQPRAAFDEIHVLNGWQLVDPVAAQAGSILGKDIRDIKELDEVELSVIAARLGVEVKENAKPADVKAAVVKALSPDEKEGAAQ